MATTPQAAFYMQHFHQALLNTTHTSCNTSHAWMHSTTCTCSCEALLKGNKCIQDLSAAASIVSASSTIMYFCCRCCKAQL